MRAGEGLLQKVNQKEPQTVTPLKIITGCHFKSPFILDRLRSIDFSLSLSPTFSLRHTPLSTPASLTLSFQNFPSFSPPLSGCNSY